MIKKLFNILGYEVLKKSTIRRLNQIDPLTHNSVEAANEFYSDEQKIKNYLSKERLKLYQSILDELNKRVSPNKVKSLLDAGAGTGAFLRTISHYTDNYMLSGTDFSEKAIKVARENCPIASFYQHDLYKPLELKYDVIMCIEVLEHMETPEKAIKNLYNALDENGTMIITVPDGRFDNYKGHIHFWSPESWKLFVDKNIKGKHEYTHLLNKFNMVVINKSN